METLTWLTMKCSDWLLSQGCERKAILIARFMSWGLLRSALHPNMLGTNRASMEVSAQSRQKVRQLSMQRRRVTFGVLASVPVNGLRHLID